MGSRMGASSAISATDSTQSIKKQLARMRRACSVSPLAHAHAHQRRAAHADQRGGRPDHRHHRAAYAHARERQIAHPGNMADVHAVHNAVQHAHKLRQHAGQRNSQNERSDRVSAQGRFFAA